MIDAALSVLVLGVVVIAISVDVAVMIDWLKAAMNRKESEQ
jgi:hypothetical protein